MPNLMGDYIALPGWFLVVGGAKDNNPEVRICQP
jgi:hypothetical protein